MSKRRGLIHEIAANKLYVQVLIADVLDFWNPTEHPGLCNSEINNQCVSRVYNDCLAVHRVLNPVFVENSIISILSSFRVVCCNL